MRWYRLLLAVVTAVALAAGVVTATAAALTADRRAVAATDAASCARFSDALEPGGTHRVCGRFLRCYDADGGPAGGFGAPISDEAPNRLRPELAGDRTQAFDRAQMFLNTTTGHIVTGGWFAYTPLGPRPRQLPSCPDPD